MYVYVQFRKNGHWPGENLFKSRRHSSIMWNPFKPKVTDLRTLRSRGPDGKFLVEDGSQDGVTAGISSQAKNMKAFTEMFSSYAEMEKKLAEMTEARDKVAIQKAEAMRTEAKDMAQQLFDSVDVEDDSDSGSLENTLMKMLEPHLPALIEKFTAGQPNNGDAFNNPSVQSPINNNGGKVSNSALAAPKPTDQPGSQLNSVLEALGKVPDKMFTKKMVKTVCKQQGIDEKLLKNVVKKLNKV